MTYVKPKIASEELGVTVQTLRLWALEGKIKYITGPGRGRLYDTSSVTNERKLPSENKVIYCRVSSFKQKDDLERQINFLKEKYPTHQVVKDIGSGINFKRKGLQRILDETIKGNISEIVVAHKDRICRIAWEHFEWMFSYFGVNVVVEDREEHSPECELADDLFSIIHVFSSRHYGRRRGYTTQIVSRSNEEKKTDI